jgi:putative Mg2+ transporter-C (MgtC) family protein
MDDVLTTPDVDQLLRIALRLVNSAMLGAVIGLEREWEGKAAGLRTHTTVALGAAAFVLGVIESGAGPDAVSRAIQGIAAGIGFIGAGTILKRSEEDDIQGLTTAATIWLTAAVGVAAGTGQVGLAIICVGCALVILTAFDRVDRWLSQKRKKRRATSS